MSAWATPITNAPPAGTQRPARRAGDDLPHPQRQAPATATAAAVAASPLSLRRARSLRRASKPQPTAPDRRQTHTQAATVDPLAKGGLPWRGRTTWSTGPSSRSAPLIVLPASVVPSAQASRSLLFTLASLGQ